MPSLKSSKWGGTASSAIETVRVMPRGSAVSKYAFDVTPARLNTERGVCPASEAGLLSLFPGAEDDRAA